MKTASVMLQTLCVPCGCHCRYCLLSWDGKTVGADYDRCAAYAAAFHKWIGKERPELSFHFSFGYSMEHPRLFGMLDFLNSIGSVTGRFLQLDGMRLRTEEEYTALTLKLREHGVRSVNLTFYGLPEYHDRFAGRKEDFVHLLALAKAAAASGLETSAGFPLTEESAPQAEAVLDILEEAGIRRFSLFVPDEEGRGITLDPVRLTVSGFEKMSPRARAYLNRQTTRTEAEWIAGPPPEPEEKRMLLISLTPENIGRFERMGFGEVLRYVEQLDDDYYAAVPSFGELAERFGDPAGDRFFRKRDLYRHWQQSWIRENGIRLYDVTDERQCGSRRY